MNPRINLVISLTLLVIFFAFHISVTQYLLLDAPKIPEVSQPTGLPSDTPDFSAITETKARKQAFFGYLEPHIATENAKIQALRDYILRPSTNASSAQIKQLAMQYRIDPGAPHVKQSLLVKIDNLPPSLVLAQAAIESAWGTSRFATQGNNFFGQWCFSAGCGLVPTQRSHGEHHEVRRFQSPADSIASYMKNLNSHPAYASLRDNRMAQHKKGEPLNGCFLAEGLIEYSERKGAYVESLKQLIRTNKLEDKHSPYCKKTTADPQNTPSPEPQNIQGHIQNDIQNNSAQG